MTMSAPEKFVAAECFSDDSLQELVRDNATATSCSFSGLKSSKPIAAPLDVVVEHIGKCLSHHYEDAANGVGWEDGEYLGAETWDTVELVQETVELGSHISNDLHYAIAEALPQQNWSYIDPYGPREGDVMKWSWQAFSETVKHIRRYFFVEHLKSTDSRSETVSPIELLKEVIGRCREFGLICEFSAGQKYFRCRSRKKRERFTEPRDMGSPPSDYASQSRMSPAGVPMFYGALDEKTAVAETLDKPRRHAIAKFLTTRPVNLLDLRKRPYVSIFDLQKGHLNEWCQFMSDFIADFQRPVTHDGKEHFEYIPTQVVTEYLRSALRGTDALDGIIYSSVKNKGGQCVVLFADRNAIDPVSPSSGSAAGKYLLVMDSVAHHR